MQTELFAIRLARNLRLPIAGAGIAALLLASAYLFFGAIKEWLVRDAAIAQGVVVAVYFLSIVFDMRFQRAFSAMNAERRARAKAGGGPEPLGWTTPGADMLLVSVSVPLLVLSLLAGNYYRHGPSAALLLAAFSLCLLAQFGLMVRGVPTDRWHPPL